MPRDALCDGRLAREKRHFSSTVGLRPTSGLSRDSMAVSPAASHGRPNAKHNSTRLSAGRVRAVPIGRGGDVRASWCVRAWVWVCVTVIRLFGKRAQARRAGCGLAMTTTSCGIDVETNRGCVQAAARKRSFEGAETLLVQEASWGHQTLANRVRLPGPPHRRTSETCLSRKMCSAIADQSLGDR